MHELNIEYEDVLYSYDETWPSVNKAKGVSLTGSLPILEIDNQRLYQVGCRGSESRTDCLSAQLN